jgi:hypothetical protein
LCQLVESERRAFQEAAKTEEPFVFEFSNGQVVVLGKETAVRAEPEILEDNLIPSLYSSDLRTTLELKETGVK